MWKRCVYVSVLIMCCAIAGCSRSAGLGGFAKPEATFKTIPPQSLTQDDLGMVTSALDTRAEKAGNEMVPVPLKMRVAWYPLITQSALQTFAIVPARAIFGPEKTFQPLPAGSQIQVYERRSVGPLGIPYMRAVRADYDEQGNNLIYSKTMNLVWGILWTDKVDRVGLAGSASVSDTRRAGILWGGFGGGHRGDRRVMYLLGFPVPIGKIKTAPIK